MDNTQTIMIGIMSREKFRERMIAIARGDYKPAPDEPKIWFNSIRSAAEILSDENRAMLREIRERHPRSISELANMTGRSQSNLSRTLKKLAHYGIVEFIDEDHRKRPVTQATSFNIVAS